MTDALTTWDVHYCIRGGHFKDEKVFAARTKMQALNKAAQHVTLMLADAVVDLHVTPSAKPKRKKPRTYSPRVSSGAHARTA